MNESRQKFSKFLYKAENVVDELVIAILSFGAMFIPIYLYFSEAQTFTFMSLGERIFPWIVMVALMLIARELWLLNRQLENADLG